jgi:adenylate kinase family enzyme
MRRVSIVGAPGSGKTTFGRGLASRLDVPFIELDAIFHQPGWTELPRDEFRARVGASLGSEGWVIDGNYPAVQDLVWQPADTVVWFDLPRRVVMRRVVLRTLRWMIRREQLWNGNREPLTNLFRLDPERNIIRWTWVMYPEYLERYSRAARQSANSHLQFVRLSSRSEIDSLIE